MRDAERAGALICSVAGRALFGARVTAERAKEFYVLRQTLADYVRVILQ